ncbi:hypothetical protein RclHR1_16330003 [Rhizophagus clarus]|uniref:Uncharacterized protein n=1 Tax=Rhizophagus clarus TaxID=94130 RepID=A0A2Z6QY33_9GLOM|nr:hypothetical protein RclHR1_16330003 [Rhizophagus clarus]
MIPEEAPEELEQEMDVDGEEEVITQPVASDKRSANEDIDSSSRKKSKKDVRLEDSNISKKAYPGVNF